MRLIFRIVAVFLLAPGLIACGSGHSSSSTGPSIVSSPAATNFFGYVGDVLFHAVADVRIDVVDGPLAGSSLTTNAQGRFFYSGAVSSGITFRASKEGYVTQTRTATSNGGNLLMAVFELEATETPVNIAGDYTLTIVADSACDLPGDQRTRSFPSTITPQPTTGDRPATHFLLQATGQNPLQTDSFSIGVAGNHVAFGLWNGEGPGLVEPVGPKTYYSVYGQADAVVGATFPATLSMPFNGVVDYCVASADRIPYDDCYYPQMSTHQTCSKNNQLILTRR